MRREDDAALLFVVAAISRPRSRSVPSSKLVENESVIVARELAVGLDQVGSRRLARTETSAISEQRRLARSRGHARLAGSCNRRARATDLPADGALPVPSRGASATKRIDLRRASRPFFRRSWWRRSPPSRRSARRSRDHASAPLLGDGAAPARRDMPRCCAGKPISRLDLAPNARARSGSPLDRMHLGAAGACGVDGGRRRDPRRRAVAALRRGARSRVRRRHLLGTARNFA